MAKAIVMRGVSGSGKSTWIRGAHPDGFVLSADHFFMKDGKYLFDPDQIAQAHHTCLRRFVLACSLAAWNHYAPTPDQEGVIIVDNTNTSLAEMAPYCAVALAYGHQLQVVNLVVDDLAVCARRNKHGVPLSAIESQQIRLIESAKHMPPWWPLTTVISPT